MTGGGASSSADAGKSASPVTPADNKTDQVSKPADSDNGAQNQSGIDTFDPNGSVKPTDAQTVADIKAWLDAHKVTYSSSATKPDLLALVNKA